MHNQLINPQLFVKNRQKFIAQMSSNAIAVFHSNDVFVSGADSVLPFEQQRDLFYLSGIEQEETILLLFPDALEKTHKELLFIKRTNEHLALWEGNQLSKEQATKVSGIQSVYWLGAFEPMLNRLMTHVNTIYLNLNERSRVGDFFQTRGDRFVELVKKSFPAHNYQRSYPILNKLRGVKEPEEIDLLQQACHITEKGFRRVLTFVKPGVKEYEIEAEFAHEFIRNQSKIFSYQPIIASGQNGCVLHYKTNKQVCQNGDLLLMDVGARYANYCSDMTRTIPVNGVFTKRQKAVYEAVLRVKNFAQELLVSGALLKDCEQEVGKFMSSELIALKLLDKATVSKDDKAYRKYYMHGTYHHLGLDTHDYGVTHEPLEAGMVLTVEPGIYIPEEKMGIRLEDDVVVQSSGNPKNLMANIPIEVEEIEELMR